MTEQDNHTPPDSIEPVSFDLVRFEPTVAIPRWPLDTRIWGLEPAAELLDTRVYLQFGDYLPSPRTLRDALALHYLIPPDFIAGLLQRVRGEPAPAPLPAVDNTPPAPLSKERRDAATSTVEVEAALPSHAPDDARVTLVLFKPSVLYRLHGGQPTVEFLGGAGRTPVSCSWGDLPKLFGRSVEGIPVRYLGNERGDHVPHDAPGARWITGVHPNMVKRGRGAWVPGTFTGTIGHRFMGDDTDRFVSTSLLVVDVDGGDPHAVASELEQYAVLIHSTYKHSPERPRCRVIFLLGAPCTSRETYNKAERFLAEQLNKSGFFVPPADSTLGKLAFLPMHAPGVEPVFIKNQGRPLDLAPILAIPAPAEPERKAIRHESGTARNALAWGRRKVLSAAFGTRHTTLFATAAWLAEATIATDDEITSTLLSAAVYVAAEGEEARSKKERCIRDAITRGRGRA